MKRTKKARTLVMEELPALILYVRNQKVVLDVDLARIYGVTTKRLNEQVRRNLNRFPEDFLFELTDHEKRQVVANCDHLINSKFSPYAPIAFTEHGAVMAATLLNSPIAVKASILVVRAFVKFREVFAMQKELTVKLRRLELKVDRNDRGIRVLFEAIRQLMNPPRAVFRSIGFRIGKK